MNNTDSSCLHTIASLDADCRNSYMQITFDNLFESAIFWHSDFFKIVNLARHMFSASNFEKHFFVINIDCNDFQWVATYCQGEGSLCETSIKRWSSTPTNQPTKLYNKARSILHHVHAYCSCIFQCAAEQCNVLQAIDLQSFEQHALRGKYKNANSILSWSIYWCAIAIQNIIIKRIAMCYN